MELPLSGHHLHRATPIPMGGGLAHPTMFIRNGGGRGHACKTLALYARYGNGVVGVPQPLDLAPLAAPEVRSADWRDF